MRKLAEQIESLKDDLDMIKLEPDGQKREIYRKKQLSDEYKAAPEDQADDYETYLTQEPEGIVQKFKSYYQNQYEIWMILVVIFMAILMPSIVSLGYFLIMCFLLHTSTYSLKFRLKIEFYFFIFLNMILIGICVWKEMKAGDMITSTRDWEAFRYEIHFYECLGFNLFYTWHTREEGDKLLAADPKFQFKISFNHFNSFLFEFILQIMLMLAYMSLSKHTQKVNKLTKPD